MSSIGTGYHMRCKRCGRRIKGATYDLCKRCRDEPWKTGPACWYCKNEMNPAEDAVIGRPEDGMPPEPMHRCCRDAHLRELDILESYDHDRD